MWKIPLFDLNFGPEEQQAVRDVLDSRWLTSGPRTKEFEARFGAYLGEGIHYQHLAAHPLEMADQICERVVTLPLYPGLSCNDCNTVCQAIHDFFGHRHN